MEQPGSRAMTMVPQIKVKEHEIKLKDKKSQTDGALPVGMC